MADNPGRLRRYEPGWVLQVQDDSSGRRGIWTREAADGCLELCSGREGDDYYLSLAPGHVLTKEDLRTLATLIMHGRAPGYCGKYRTCESEPSAGQGLVRRNDRTSGQGTAVPAPEIDYYEAKMPVNDKVMSKLETEHCPWCGKLLKKLSPRVKQRDIKDWTGKEQDAPYAPGTRPHKCDRRRLPVRTNDVKKSAQPA